MWEGGCIDEFEEKIPDLFCNIFFLPQIGGCKSKIQKGVGNCIFIVRFGYLVLRVNVGQIRVKD